MSSPQIDQPCPGCGFFIHDESAYGSYIICQLCGWEDDPVQLANPLTAIGANGDASLFEYEQRALAEWPLNLSEMEHRGKSYRRDLRWRPLSEAEIEYYALHTDNGRTFAFKAIDSLDECYWMKNGLPP